MYLSRSFRIAILEYAKRKFPEQFESHSWEEISILKIKPSATSIGFHVVWILADGDDKVRQVMMPLAH